MNKIHSTAILLLHQIVCCDCKISPSDCTVQNEESTGSTSVNCLPSVLTYNSVGQPFTIHCNQQPLTKVGKCSKIQFSSPPRHRAGLIQFGNYVSDVVLLAVSTISAHLSSCKLCPCESLIWSPRRRPCSVVIGECLRVPNKGIFPGQSC